MKKTLLFIVLSLIQLAADAQVRFIQTNDLSDYETVLETVKQQDKLLWVAIHEDQGDFRKMYFDGVFKDQALSRLSSVYTNVAINVDGEMGLRFQEIFAFDELPSFLVLNADEFVIAKIDGYQSAANLYSLLNEAAKAPYYYDSLLLAYQAHELSEAQWIDLLELYALNFDYNSTCLLALEYLNTKEADSLLMAPSIEILAAYGVDLETPYPDLVLEHIDTIKGAVKGFDLNAYQAQAMDYNLDLAIANKDSKLMKKAIDRFLKPPYCPADSLETCEENFQRVYAYNSSDFSLYQEMIRQKADGMAPTLSAEFLFDEAYEITENYNSKQAKEAAYQLSAYSNQKKASFKARMLMAYSKYLSEDYNQAKIDLSLAKELISNPKELESANKLEKLIEDKD